MHFVNLKVLKYILNHCFNNLLVLDYNLNSGVLFKNYI